jgi:Tfp pilus assembly protein PilN
MKTALLERYSTLQLMVRRGARRLQSSAVPAPAHLMLDFASPQRRPSGPGLAALLIGATLLSLAMMQSDMQASRIASLESELSALGVDIEARRNKERRPSQKSADLDDRVAKANRIIKLLSPPWEDVFNTVESLNGKDIAILSLEPELGSAQVRIGAEARNTRAMFDYLERMRNSGRLSPVVLQAHQVMTEDPHKPIRFGFTASWITAKNATN